MASRQRPRKGRPKGGKTPTVAHSPLATKQPRLRFHPEAAKTPLTADPRDFLQCHPRWRFSLLQLDGPYGWSALSLADAQELTGSLRQLERRKWSEIFVRSKKHNHSVTVDLLSPAARKELRRHQLDDRDELWSLRITGRQRVWGILEEDVFYLLWWDPEHRVCPSMLRHT